MNAAIQPMTKPRTDTARHARFIKASRDSTCAIPRDVLLDRKFNFRQKFLPDGLSKVNELAFLTESEERSLSRVQGRTYAFLFGLLERSVAAKSRNGSRGDWLGDQAAPEALVHFAGEEMKQRDLFWRLEALIAGGMPGGYSTSATPDDLAQMVLSKASWAVLALTCHVKLLVQRHYIHSIDKDVSLSPQFKEIFRLHWQDEYRHLVPKELEWRAVDARLTPAERDVAVDDLIELVTTVDRIVQAQAALDAAYFLRLCNRNFTDVDQRAIRALLVKAYRWQYIVSGVRHQHFRRLLAQLTTPGQLQRIQRALVPIINGGM